MLIKSTPDAFIKLSEISDSTAFEPVGDEPHQERQSTPRYQSHSLEECITNVSTPKGAMPVLKTMLTTACERNCNYCPFRAGRGRTHRVTIKPDELAAAFNTLQRHGKVKGMFLSSGIIKGSVTTQDKIIDTAEIVRKKYGYRGYLHLKIMPGIEYDQLVRLMQLADRVSVNLEGPTDARVKALAPKKDFSVELIKMLRWAEDIRQANPHQKLASTVSQFVVGAVGDTDVEILSTSDRLYRQMHLSRIYYCAFHPIEQTPFENLPAVDSIREFRLYQSSFLLRDYAWEVEDLPFIGPGNLRTDVDPKHAWAEIHLLHTPIDVMKADRQQLLRIPGIGPVGAEAILNARRQSRLTDLSDLRKLVRGIDKAAPYILLDGRRPSFQLKLF